jgi:hypothetical protein
VRRPSASNTFLSKQPGRGESNSAGSSLPAVLFGLPARRCCCRGRARRRLPHRGLGDALRSPPGRRYSGAWTRRAGRIRRDIVGTLRAGEWRKRRSGTRSKHRTIVRSCRGRPHHVRSSHICPSHVRRIEVRRKPVCPEDDETWISGTGHVKRLSRITGRIYSSRSCHGPCPARSSGLGDDGLARSRSAYHPATRSRPSSAGPEIAVCQRQSRINSGGPISIQRRRFRKSFRLKVRYKNLIRARWPAGPALIPRIRKYRPWQRHEA